MRQIDASHLNTQAATTATPKPKQVLQLTDKQDLGTASVASGSPNNAMRQAEVIVQEWKGEETWNEIVTRYNNEANPETFSSLGKEQTFDEKREHEKDLEHESRMDYESDQLAGNPPDDFYGDTELDEPNVE